MKKYITMLLVTIMLMFNMGCMKTDVEPTKFKTICLDGVTYYILKQKSGYSGYGFMSVKFDRNSKVVLCDNDDAPDFRENMSIIGE